MKDPKVPIVDALKLNAISDPYKLLEIASSHENEKVSKAALEKLLDLKGLIDDRKVILICRVVSDTKYESIAEHAFRYCSAASIPDEVKAHILKCWLSKIKFESVRKKTKDWLKKHRY
ncbi:hypothetical protein H0N99_00425 [Candidatus Micrarchaeota archaeon]|nr:hypothetical protein [Candidatus Micrarchaeota archaeon]